MLRTYICRVSRLTALSHVRLHYDCICAVSLRHAAHGFRGLCSQGEMAEAWPLADRPSRRRFFSQAVGCRLPAAR